MTNLSLKSQTDREQINRKCIIILGALYFIALLWIVVFKCNIIEYLHIDDNRAFDLLGRLEFALFSEPFHDLEYSLSKGDWGEVFAIIINVMGFVPLGLAYRFFFKKSSAYFLSFATGLGIELFQLFSCYGGLKIEDLVEYMLGAVVGIVLFEKVIHKIPPQTINNIARVLIYTAIPFDLFFIINTIIHFPG